LDWRSLLHNALSRRERRLLSIRQNSYNANGCSDTSSGSCSGLYHDGSLVADYKLSLRFDVYGGVNYSRAVDGMASGFLSDHNWASMLGIRFVF